jgi:hypothetical protein
MALTSQRWRAMAQASDAATRRGQVTASEWLEDRTGALHLHTLRVFANLPHKPTLDTKSIVVRLTKLRTK